MSGQPPAWDPAALERLRALHLRARRLAAGLSRGAHRAGRVGEGVEFSDYQPYLPGMDLRHLAWKVVARTDRLVVRRCEAETELDCTVILDLSGDLCTGGGPGRLPDLEHSKAGTAITLAATLCYWLHAQGERVGLDVLGGDAPLGRTLPPGRGRSHLGRLLSTLSTARPGGVADLSSGLLRAGARLRRRGWVAVITDGMEEPAAWLPALGSLSGRGADLRLIHLFHPEEWALVGDEGVRLYSPEGGEELDLDPRVARAAFAEAVRTYAEEVRAGVTGTGGLYLPLAAEGSVGELIARLALGLSGASWG